MKKILVIGIVMIPFLTFIAYHYINQRNTEPRLNFKDIFQITYIPGKSIEAIELVNEYANIEKIEFPVIKNELGEQILVYKIIGKNGKSQVYSKKIMIVDKTPPQINLSKTDIEIEDTINEETMKSYLQTEDDVTSKEHLNIQLIYSPFVVGKNVVQYKVCDTDNNCSTAVLNVHKKEEKKEETASTTPNSDNQAGSTVSNAVIQNDRNKQAVATPTQKTIQPIIKRFWYKDGYNKKTGFTACQKFVAAYEDERATSCKPFSENDQELGYEAIIR